MKSIKQLICDLLGWHEDTYCREGSRLWVVCDRCGRVSSGINISKAA